jgi:hypothetical protein
MPSITTFSGSKDIKVLDMPVNTDINAIALKPYLVHTMKKVCPGDKERMLAVGGVRRNSLLCPSQQYIFLIGCVAYKRTFVQSTRKMNPSNPYRPDEHEPLLENKHTHLRTSKTVQRHKLRLWFQCTLPTVLLSQG